MTMQKRYWVIGGDYADMGFRQIRPGTHTIEGPFDNAQQAKAAWQNLSRQFSSSATARFAITAERVRLPA